MRPNRPFSVLALCLIAAPAMAAGSYELGNQAVKTDTVVYVDIFDAAVETIYWTGEGRITVTDPGGAVLGSFDPGAEIALTPGSDGPYEVTFARIQDADWSIEVRNQTVNGERVYSYNWYLDGGGYRESNGFDGSFFVLVSAGDEDSNVVVELRAEGLSGYEWNMLANGSGIDGVGAGRSVDCSDPVCADQSWSADFPVYLNPPAIAAYTALSPTVGNLAFTAGELEECQQISIGDTVGTFSFDSNVQGTYHLICDLNGDGVFDLTSNDDVALNGPAEVGSNSVEWDGTDNSGDYVGIGSYDCQVTVAVGEFHYVAIDMETSYPGFQFFSISGDGSTEPMPMYWNDRNVQDQAIEMPNGELGVGTSGVDGIDPGAYVAPIQANVNARSWGDFENDGKGDTNLLDTFTYVEAATSDTLVIEAADPETDTDGDGLPDYLEDCVHGTDPDNADSDGDGISDGDEVEQGYDPNDETDTPPIEEPPVEELVGTFKGGACSAAGGAGALGLGWLLALGFAARRRD